MKTALLFLNGLPPKYNSDEKYDIIGCTDGAYHYVKNLKVALDFVIGDFDSIHPKEIENVAIIETPNQNYTDFEKAIQYLITKEIKKVNVWGGFGKEEDHFLGNISVLFQYSKKIEMIFHSENNYCMIAKKQNTFEVEKNKIVSLFPINQVKNMTTFGLEFPLKNENLKFGKRIGIRNKSVENQIIINLEKGKLLIFIEK